MNGNIAMVAGEVSGDLTGGALASHLLMLEPNWNLWGIGSACMRIAGVELMYDSAEWSAIGIVESLAKAPRLWLIFQELKRRLLRERPSVVILIDFGAFNSRVARFCHQHRLRTLYYFPPGSWRRQGYASAKLAKYCNLIASPFPWAASIWKEAGASAEFVSHPLLDLARPEMTGSEFADRYGMKVDAPIIGLLPGSRPFEVEHNTPVMLDAARLIQKQIQNAQFVVAKAPGVNQQVIERYVQNANQHGRRNGRRFSLIEMIDRSAKIKSDEAGKRESIRAITPEGFEISASCNQPLLSHRWRVVQPASQTDTIPILILGDHRFDLMAHSDCLIICSGTATLEAAILQTPMVIIYRGSRLMEVEYRLRRIRKKVEHIGMPNILANRRICPELIQDEATPEAIANLVVEYLLSPQRRSEVQVALGEVKSLLGNGGASERTARLALSLAHQEQPLDY